MTANNTTFIARVERIDMPYWAQGLTGTFSTDLVAELCNGEKSCL
jgi:hypothetical protein